MIWTQIGLLKNEPTNYTSHMSIMAMPNLMMVHYFWLKKMPVELRKVAQKGYTVQKISIFSANLPPEDSATG